MKVSILEDRERELADRAQASLHELADQNARFGRLIEQNEDRASLILHGLKYFLNSYLQAAVEHCDHIKDTGLPFKQKLLIRAQVQLEVAGAMEEIIKGEGRGFFTETIAEQARESLAAEVKALEEEVEDLQQQADQMLLQIQGIEEQIKEKERQIMAGIDQSPDKEALRLTHDSVELKIRSFAAQIDMLDFKRQKLMPGQQRLISLRMILGSIPELDDFTIN